MNDRLIKLAEMHGYDWILFFLHIICTDELKSFFHISDLLKYLGYIRKEQ